MVKVQHAKLLKALCIALLTLLLLGWVITVSVSASESGRRNTRNALGVLAVGLIASGEKDAGLVALGATAVAQSRYQDSRSDREKREGYDYGYGDSHTGWGYETRPISARQRETYRDYSYYAPTRDRRDYSYSSSFYQPASAHSYAPSNYYDNRRDSGYSDYYSWDTGYQQSYRPTYVREARPTYSAPRPQTQTVRQTTTTTTYQSSSPRPVYRETRTIETTRVIYTDCGSRQVIRVFIHQ